MERITYLDFVLKLSGDGGYYTATVLSSPGGEGQVSFTLPFSADKLENLILRMTRLRWSRGKDSPEMAAARELGSGLFQAVFQGAVRDCLVKSQDKITEHSGLRIKLRLQEAPELADLPWEFLFDPGERSFLAQSAYTPIVRYLEFPGSLSPLKAALPLHILGVVANPIDRKPPLNVKDEQQRLESALAELVKQGLVSITWLEQATLEGLRQKLRLGRYHVFHFIGHGYFNRRDAQGVLVFTDEAGRSQDVDAERLGVLLRDHKALRLVLLNACEGARTSPEDPFAGTAAHLVRQGIPAVVAMQFAISDASSRAFAGEFFAALAQGLPVDAAQAEARKAIFCLPEDVEWGTPVLFLRSPDGVLFDITAPTETPPAVKPVEPPPTPAEVKKTAPTEPAPQKKTSTTVPPQPAAPRDPEKDVPSDLYTFVYLPECRGWIGKYPVTNLQYQRFLEAPDFADARFWVNFLKFGPPPDYQRLGGWVDVGWQWLQRILKDKQYSPDGQWVIPRRWTSTDFGIQRPLVPVVGVTWYEANAYGKWLQAHWDACEEAQQNPDLRAGMLRLPTEREWEEAAGGIQPEGRYVWDAPGKVTTDRAEVVRRANVSESKINRTTPVNKYPLGQSPLGVWDLTGNVWEWQANQWSKGDTGRVVRGGCWSDARNYARAASRDRGGPDFFNLNLGFRVVRFPI